MHIELKFLIVDDQKIIRESLAEKICFLFDGSKVATASSGKEGMKLAADFMPDIILMDISMPVMDGIEATKLILLNHPKQKIIAVSMNDNDEMVNKMITAGAKGYLLKTDDMIDYKEAIERIMNEEIYISRSIAK